MKKILVVKSSILEANSQSNSLIDCFLESIENKISSIDIRVRNIGEDNLPHFNGYHLNALMTAKENRDREQQEFVDVADQLIEQVKSADVILLSAPMYNFGIPSQLKTFFDYIARAGVTFKYTETGAVGLLDSKPVYIISTKGGFYQESGTDFLTPFVKQYLNFIGLSEVNFINVEGLNFSSETKGSSLKQAVQDINDLVELHFSNFPSY